MKKKIVYCLIFSFAIILQTSVLPLLSPLHATGDILLMLVLAGAILEGFFSFLWWAIFAGIVFDLVSYTTVGVHALIFLFIVYFVSFFSRRFSVELRGVGLLLFMVFVIVATFASRAVIALLMAWDLQTFNGYLKNFGSFEIVSVQILYNVLLFVVCFLALRKIKKFFEI